MALDKRFYGDLQGLNKVRTAEKYGADVMQVWQGDIDDVDNTGQATNKIILN